MQAQLKSPYSNIPSSQDSNYACLPESNPPQETNQQIITQNAIVRDIKITVENRIFNLNLDNFEAHCRNNIMQIFKDKDYSLEELLVLFVSNIRDQSLAETELNKILQSLNASS